MSVQKLGPKAVLVDVEGEVNLSTSPSFQEPMITLVRSGCRHLVVSLENVKFMDTSGLGVLIGAYRLVQEHHGDMNVICSNPKILKLLEITNFTKLVKVFEKREEAIESVSAVAAPSKGV